MENSIATLKEKIKKFGRKKTKELEELEKKLAAAEKKLSAWNERHAFVEAVVLWNQYRFHRDKFFHTKESVQHLRDLRIAAVEKLVKSVKQKTSWQQVPN